MANRTHKKRPRDPNQLGKLIVDISVGAVEDQKTIRAAKGKHAGAIELGRRGGLKGGPARAASLSTDERKEIARRAAVARWKRAKKSQG